MVPPPFALGLILCDYAILEEGTAKVSLIGTFTKRNVKAFPSETTPFFVFAALTAGFGDATITLTLTRLNHRA